MKRLLVVVSIFLCLSILIVSLLGCAKKEKAEKPAKEEVAPAETIEVAPAETLEAAPPETLQTE